MIETGTTGPLRWAALGRSLSEGEASGDRHVVLPASDGALVAVIDGLGHGPEAAAAADAAADELARDPSRPVDDALRACHRALAGTRGAVMSIARAEGARLRWVGVGNVEAALLRGAQSRTPPARLLLAGGVVGHALPTLRVGEAPIGRGDLLVLGTDGLRGGFLDHVERAASPSRVVQTLVARCATGRDDVLALAARYDGAPA